MKPSKKLFLILTFTMSFLAAGYSQLLGANSLPIRPNYLSALSSKSDSKDGSSSDQVVWVWDYIEGKVITDEKGQKIDSYNYLKGELNKAVQKTKQLDIPTVKVLSLAEKNGNIETRTNNGEKEIRMVTWTKKRYFKDFIENGKKFPKLERLTWVTAKPQVYNFCNQTSGVGGNLSHISREMMLDLRLTQYLGLKPEKAGETDPKYKDSFVEMWVKQKDLKRPCTDESVDTKKCKIDKEGMKQVKERFFPKDEIDYPFTGLGYTYDWGKPSPVGPSEFVIEASKDKPVEVEVVSVDSTKDYCKNNKISAPE